MGEAAKYFTSFNADVVNHPKVEIIYDDARHYLATTQEKFDIITSDPIHPWVRGAASLFSHEYYQLVQKKLKPDGVIAQWIPLYENSEEAIKIQMKTFIRNFQHTTVWFPIHPQFPYDAIMIAQNQSDAKIDIIELQNLIERNPPLKQSLDMVGLSETSRLFGTYTCSGEDLKEWVKHSTVNHDSHMKLEYIAGLNSHVNHQRKIMHSMAQHCTFPEYIFQPYDTAKFERLLEMIRQNQYFRKRLY